jgi:hypothetical protein
MRLKLLKSLSTGALCCTLACTVHAGTSAADIARLGGPELTPIGAERAGNADGSIPAWTGGITEIPATFKEGERLPDPFPDEKPLFSITIDNYQEHAELLSDGQIATLKRYPQTYRIPVYPSHRTAIYPQEVYDSLLQNAPNAGLVKGGNGVTGLGAGTVPFPFPQQGIEVFWNHVLRYRGRGSNRGNSVQAAVQSNGNFVPVWFETQVSWARDMPDNDNPNRLFMFLQKIKAPARLEGDVLLVHEFVDQVKEPRNAWIYNPGQRRVRRAPEVAYDGPGTASDNLRTADDLDMMNGAPDRYDWKLLGKKEMYIPYNAYKLTSGDLKYTDILIPGHMNPEYLRYEKHRVWVVDATLKSGSRHVYARRKMYIDEDTWQIAMVDVYDGRGELWRFHEGHAMVHYHVQIPWLAAESQYDLISGRYVVNGLSNEMPGYQNEFDLPGLTMGDYTPSALRRAGK